MAVHTVRLTLCTIGFFIGVILFVGGAVFGWSILPRAVKQDINNFLLLEDGTELFNKWINITNEVKIKFHMFNITNPQALENPGERIQMEELGPYVYNERREKVNIRWGDGTVSYREKITYYFNENESIGSENDIINTLNFPFITFAHVSYAMDIPMASLFINFTTENDEIPERIIKQNVTVGQVLFEGWKLRDTYKMIPLDEIPPELKDFQFGYYRTLNGTPGKEFTVKTGKAKDRADICQVVSYDNMTKLTWWNNTEPNGELKASSEQFCNKINGTDRSLFPPFLTKNTTLDIFSPMACRSMRKVFHSEEEYKGIPAYRFKLDDSFLADPITNKYEACFCQRQSPKLADYCLRGFYRMWPCAQGAPLVLSNPHFLNGDTSLHNPIDIDPPDPPLHDTYFLIEPNTGSILSARARFQINIELQRIPDFMSFDALNFTEFNEGLESIILPIFWMEEEVEMTNKDIEKIKKLANALSGIQKAKWSCILGGLLVMTISIVSLGRTMS